jgi:Flp pilus assembly protein TadD
MSKKKFETVGPRKTQPQSGLAKKRQIMDEAEQLILSDEAEKALELLEPLVERYPKDDELFSLLGFASVRLNDLWNGAIHYRRAYELSHDPGLNIPLALLYIELGFRSLALRAFRLIQLRRFELPEELDVSVLIQGIMSDIQRMADAFQLNVKEAEEGLCWMEDAEIALHQKDYVRCIQLNRRAIRLLDGFPAPYNNLSMALFFNGRPEEAIQTVRQVLAMHPENIQALGNLIRFQAWTGQLEEAQSTWQLLKPLPPENIDNLLKKVEAGAIMEDDSTVYDLLKKMDFEEIVDWALADKMEIFFAISQANLGKIRAAKKILVTQSEFDYQAEQILKAIYNNQKGLGWSERFSYHHIGEILPAREWQSLLRLMERRSEGESARLKRELDHFIKRFPQLILVGKKLLYEEQQVIPAIDLLTALDNPAAYAILREFSLGQLGEDDDRMRALFALQLAGEIPQGEVVTIWRKGQPREVRMQLQQVRQDVKSPYNPQVANLLNDGLKAYQAGKYNKAEHIFKKVLELEPQAKEAYNNLGSIYAKQDQIDKARLMMNKAIEIDPLYVLPRSNLAMFLLEEGKIEEAEAMIAPMVDVEVFSPQAMVFLSYVRARLAVEQKDWEAAINSLELALQIDPDYEPAQKMLQNLKTVDLLRSSFSSWHERDLVRREKKRKQLQAKLTTSDPSLKEALGLYTREVLTSIARATLLHGGWSTLKKAELQRYLEEQLQIPYVLESVIGSLTESERHALRQLLDKGGWMGWEDFNTRHDNDLEESPYWQWHEPETVMGRLRQRLLLVEATVQEELILTIPNELRILLQELV